MPDDDVQTTKMVHFTELCGTQTLLNGIARCVRLRFTVATVCFGGSQVTFVVFGAKSKQRIVYSVHNGNYAQFFCVESSSPPAATQLNERSNCVNFGMRLVVCLCACHSNLLSECNAPCEQKTIIIAQLQIRTSQLCDRQPNDSGCSNSKQQELRIEENKKPRTKMTRELHTICI